jgi:hypothetical protein
MVETVCAILKKLMRVGKIFHRLEIRTAQIKKAMLHIRVPQVIWVTCRSVLM